MAENDGQIGPPGDAASVPITASNTVEKSLRESGTWVAIQQGAQVFAELGGGAAGIATAAHLAKQSFKGSSKPPSDAGSGSSSAEGSDPPN